MSTKKLHRMKSKAFYRITAPTKTGLWRIKSHPVEFNAFKEEIAITIKDFAQQQERLREKSENKVLGLETT